MFARLAKCNIWEKELKNTDFHPKTYIIEFQQLGFFNLLN